MAKCDQLQLLMRLDIRITTSCILHLRARSGDAAYVDMTSIIHTHAEFGALRVMPPAERSAHRVGCASSMISDR